MIRGPWFTNTSAGSGGSWNSTAPDGTSRRADHILTIEYASGGAPSSIAVTLGGVSMTPHPDGPALADNGSFVEATYEFYLDEAGGLPAAGTRAVVCTVVGGTGVGGIHQAITYTQEAAQGAPTLIKASNPDTATLTLSSTIPEGGAALAGICVNGGISVTFAGSAATWTERWDETGTGGDAASAGADTETAGADTLTATASTATRMSGVVVVLSNVSGSVTITDVDPATGTTAGGTAVTLTGTGFTAGDGVRFGSNDATSVVVVDAMTITCVTPAGSLGAVDVHVRRSGSNVATAAGGFTYVLPPPLPNVILEFQPA